MTVAIVGAALSACGRVDDRTPFSLVQEASRRALDDAGLTKADVDGFGSTGLGLLPPIEVAEYCGLRPLWTDSTSVGGSAWEFMAEHAVAAIEAGLAKVVLLSYGSTARADLKAGRRRANSNFGTSGPAQFEAAYGHTLISKYAMVARRHMHEYGTTIDQLAAIAVSMRANAGLNPEAYYREPIAVDDVHAAPMVADPLTSLHCCIRSDGGGAVVLTSLERAKDCNKRPIVVLGTGQACSHTTMSEFPSFTESPARRSGQLAFDRANLTPADVDVCQIYDAFTSMLLVSLESLGFCGRGEAGAFVENGRLEVGGTLPTNTDGGGLSACHPGIRGMFLMVEAVRQLRGEGALRQVQGAEVACVNATGGWFSSAATMLLGRG